VLAFGDEIDLLEHGWGKSDEDFLGHGHLLRRKNKRSETRTQEDNVFLCDPKLSRFLIKTNR